MLQNIYIFVDKSQSAFVPLPFFCGATPKFYLNCRGNMHNYDVLIVGTGIAGLSFALKLAELRPDVSILLITKGIAPESNTKYAQGGIAAVTDKSNDSFEQHINDTLKAGRGLCDAYIVEKVIKSAPERILELTDWGVEWDTDSYGNWHLVKEGGHSQARILHHKDFTGWEIERKLLQKFEKLNNLTISAYTWAIDLHVENGECKGLYYFDNEKQKPEFIRAKVIYMAAGGSGQLFKLTTNPPVATGDGVALAARAGAEIKDFQYFQFHPTALYDVKNQSDAAFLISEAVRGFGAHILNHQGERFIFQYDERGELATRDIVSRAILSELSKSGKDCVFLSIKHLDIEAFKEHFPTIYQHCSALGISLPEDGIPVLPAAHYQCGGIKVDELGETSLKNLYAGGECACTGLHGANRLASNSLLEALVFSHESAMKIGKIIDEIAFESVVEREFAKKEFFHEEEFAAIKAELKNEVSKAVFSDFDEVFKEKLAKKIRLWADKVENADFAYDLKLSELRNLLSIAPLVLEKKVY